MRQPEASFDLNLDLLKPHEEWVKAPAIVPPPEPVSAQKPESKQPAKPVPKGMGAKLGRGKS